MKIKDRKGVLQAFRFPVLSSVVEALAEASSFLPVLKQRVEVVIQFPVVHMIKGTTQYGQSTGMRLGIAKS